jgi:hypothetical protein
VADINLSVMGMHDWKWTRTRRAWHQVFGGVIASGSEGLGFITIKQKKL